MAKTRSGKTVGGSSKSGGNLKSTYVDNAALIAKIKEDIKKLQSKNNKAKRAMKKKNKQYIGTTKRDTPYMGCVNSAASSKSIGNCLDTDADEGNRCTRYDRGGNVCAETPDVLVPVALHLYALQKECWEGSNTHALNQAIQAWKTSCELYVSGAYNHLFIRARENNDPKPEVIPSSITKPILKRANKTVTPLSTPLKPARKAPENEDKDSNESVQDSGSKESLDEDELEKELF